MPNLRFFWRTLCEIKCLATVTVSVHQKYQQ